MTRETSKPGQAPDPQERDPLDDAERGEPPAGEPPAERAAAPEREPGGNGAGKNKDEEDEGGLGFVVRDRRFWNLDEKELEQEQERAEVPTYVEQLQRQVEEKDRLLREYITAYKQEVGEGLEKTKQRLTRDAEQQLAQARGRMAEPMLDVLDAIERSLEAAQATGNLEALVQGIQMVHLLMTQKLGELGLDRIPTVGYPFDPALHEAMGVTPVQDPAQDKQVVAELKPGFPRGEKVIRAAPVLVGRQQQEG